MGKVIGIDLGTTNSVAATMDRGEPQIIINEEGGRVTPSIVGFSPMGDRFVGEIAKRQILINPASTLHSIKRFIGRKFEECKDDIANVSFEVVKADNGECAIKLEDETLSPQEISAFILAKIKGAAEDFLGEPVTEAVITVPAYFTDSQRQATRDSGTIAGLDVLRIINEPTAAALAYVHKRKEASTIAVFDFGGGTFDISILHVESDVAEVRATRGNNRLGGADVDQVVVEWLAEQFESENGIDIRDDSIVMQRLRDAAERAKMDLSAGSLSDIHLPFLVSDQSGPKHLQVQLKRDKFEELADDIFQQTIQECKQALIDSNLNIKEIDEVIMVGGSSRIPKVQELVRDLFKRPLNKGFNPDEVVAVGAAVQAGILEGEVNAVTLLDVCNFSLGIEVEGGRFAKLIKKNSPIPTQKTQIVSTVIDNQRTVKIHVLQGENEKVSKNVSLGEFELTNIQPGTRGVPRILVRFAIDANGIVNVSAKDKRTGVSEQVVIESSTSMSDKEIKKLQEKVAAPKVDPQLKAAKASIEKIIESLEEIVREHKEDLDPKDITDCEQAIGRGKTAVRKSHEVENVQNVQIYLERIQGVISKKVDDLSTDADD